MEKKILLILAFCLLSNILRAQNITISGNVTDATSKDLLAGVSIHIKGGTNGTSTSATGQFTLNANANDILIVTYTGYKPLTISINGRHLLTLKLESNVSQLNEVVSIGTRSSGRVKLETPVPIDVVNVSKAAVTSGRSDLTDILNYAAPSFNYNKQSGSDGADHVELGTLRGLGPDQTLVLINGKRRHSTAFVAVFGTRGRGNSGVDLSSIPMAAIDHVEILRDGASAQYGSDAIAGVINLVLKKNVNDFAINAGFSNYYDPKFNSKFSVAKAEYPHAGTFDGNAFTIDMNYGVALGKHDGFINFSADYGTSGKTFRQTHDTAYANQQALPYNTVRRANGDGSAQNADIFFNAEVPLAATRTTFYSFGGFSFKNSNDYAFTRNFSAQTIRFPRDASGSFIPTPGIIFTSPTDSYFNPIIQTHNTDIALALGLKGVIGKNTDWDLSNNLGNNTFNFYGDQTFNPSLGNRKTNFFDGGPQFLQNTTNLNLSKHYDFLSGFNVGAGAEYRYERYKIQAGESDSYKNYDNYNSGTGSQGFPGFQPKDVVTANRSVAGIFLDLEADITKKWLIDFANRVEHYSDFGYNYSTKLATRYKITDNFNLRASAGTGFRAPSLQQINYSSSYTNGQGAYLSEVEIAPNKSPLTQAAGIPNLKQETSKNYGFGFTFRPLPELSITADAYQIQVKNRIVLSGQFSSSDTTLNPVFIQALNAQHVTAAQFFANAVNTTNRGLDVVIDFNKSFGDNHVRIIFTGNFQHMTIDRVNYPPILSSTTLLKQTFLSDREKDFILASAPPQKIILNPEYGFKGFTVGLRFTYFGKISLLGYGHNFDGLFPVVPLDNAPTTLLADRYNYSGKTISDLYITYKIGKKAHFSVGCDNIFNLHPDLGVIQGAKGHSATAANYSGYAYNNEPGSPFDAIQMGQNGRRFFAKIGFDF